MGKASFHVFDRKVKGSDVGVNRVYTLLTPFEAKWLHALATAGTPGATDEVDKTSLLTRLAAARDGKEPLQSGEAAYYQ